jgi:hypothetical protein
VHVAEHDVALAVRIEKCAPVIETIENVTGWQVRTANCTGRNVVSPLAEQARARRLRTAPDDP